MRGASEDGGGDKMNVGSNGVVCLVFGVRLLARGIEERGVDTDAYDTG
jgi:hypothetical protein